MFDRLKTMLIKEAIQILRDPKMRFIILVIPAIQITLFGYAVNTDVKHIATAVYDLDNSALSRDLVARLERSGYFDIVQRVQRGDELRDLLDRGKIRAAVQINRGFEEDIRAGRTATLPIIVDGTDPSTARIVVSYSVAIAERFSDQILADYSLRKGGRTMGAKGIELESRAWFNANLESRNYYVPGVIASMVLITTMMLSSMAVVREKEIGTMEQIIVTPIQRWEFIVGKLVPFAIVGYINVTIVTCIALFWFKIPLRGSILLLIGSTALFLMSTLGFGLLISTISRTQQQAMMSSFMFTFPAMLLSGFAFPIENMPMSIQYATYLNPLRYYLVIVRGIFLKGIGLGILWPQLAALALLGSVVLLFAVGRFKKSVG
ncbi:ABC transporter permease [Geobacter sulfurreducens]|jgi:ABC-2 type transport system permease protein|uniref:ABC transporter permease n=1 Tax=Geobacter sulfurreducens TaxID=35554 RepID=UPI0001E34213|nr:ABC transporter permease [Geobacter sulfurreducens]ADI85579.2 ABC transporter, membrane protein [Geobacter sulfurreducens KN400]AJY69093.1 ABC transporter permease [Geobacter sulfurreducens]QVW34641.1 ABC transporter permease [Geobacter sulfurreducens]UTG92146.1 ABC transporter permease [Geobacter sulfurreducens]